MEKTLLISLDFLEYTPQKYVDIFLTKIEQLNFKACFYSRNEQRLMQYSNIINKGKNIYLNTRQGVNDYTARYDNSSFVVIGCKNKDFELAVNHKILYITPTWFKIIENKAEIYGIKTNFNQLIAFLESVNNQNNWFSSTTLPDGTTILSLTDARYIKARTQSLLESEVSEIIEDTLKRGRLEHRNIYLYHCLSGISNYSTIFNDVNHWCIVPSSSGDLSNNEMFNFKESIRMMMKGQPLRTQDYRNYPNLILRHTANNKTHDLPKHIRIREGCKLHFPTICINPAYKNKLSGKNVCVFDDYLTHGNSFETIRNLLRKAGVNKIILVTVGTFCNPYQYQEYDFEGDIYLPNYTPKFLNRYPIYMNNFNVNPNAKKEVENLHSIFNL